LLLLYILLLQVVVYMQQQLADPVRVYLCQPSLRPFKMHPELVENSSTLTNIMSLLTQRQLTCRSFPATPTPPPAAASAAAVPGGAAREQGSTHSSNAAGAAAIHSPAVSSSGILLSCVVVKRQDGSCCSRVKLTEQHSIAQLRAAIEEAEVRHRDVAENSK
jgi:hypothetical protein